MSNPTMSDPQISTYILPQSVLGYLWFWIWFAQSSYWLIYAACSCLNHAEAFDYGLYVWANLATGSGICWLNSSYRMARYGPCISTISK